MFSPDASQIPGIAANVGAFQLPDGSTDAALLLHLPPGTYTLVVESAANQAGTALTEIYELDNTGAFASLSTAASLSAAQPVLAGGFIVHGTAPKKFLIRAVGPALGTLGVSGVLADPVLTINSGATVVARNDDWLVPASSNAADPTAIAAAATACGAFALPAGGKDAAVLVALAPGSYTAQVSASTAALSVAAAKEGLVLLEIYGVP